MKFWHRVYAAILALFLLCLAAVISIVQTISREQSLNAKINEALTAQQHIVQTMAQDIATLSEKRPAALLSLYEYYAQEFFADGILEVYQDRAPIYSHTPSGTAAPGERPELNAGTGEQIHLVRWYSGERYLFVANGLPDSLQGIVIVTATSMETFYQQWESMGTMLWTIGAIIAAVFAVALYFTLRSMYRPLFAVTQTARELEKGNLKARAPDGRKDEFGTLAASLNGMAETVSEQMDALTAAADEKQRLIDNLAHEMRTPLTAIAAWTQTMQNANLNDEERLEAENTILHEAGRLSSLSHQLLQLSVLKHEPLATQEIDVAALLCRVARVATPKAAEKQVRLDYEDSPAFSTIDANEALLESLLVNLVDNGVKACAPQGCVSITTKREPEALMFCVHDTGCGMDEETLAHLGQPFYRADVARSRKQGGAGLGVSLCFAIAEQHGASLTYESKIGKGTTAIVTFATQRQETDNSMTSSDYSDSSGSAKANTHQNKWEGSK